MTPRALVERLLALLGPGRRVRYRGLRGVGEGWERLAERRLARLGYRILERNFRARAGEIDFIAEEAGVLCFVEVKGRRSVSRGTPEEAVTVEKQRRIFRAAQEYLRRRRLGARPCRFDVVAILEAEGRTEVKVLRSAFGQPPPRRRD